jgi:hypothetical protein
MAFGLAGGIVGANADPHEAAIALPIIGFTGTVLVAYLALTALPGLVAGVGLLKSRPWARVLGIVVAVFYLIHIPFGTVIGIYALWVLLSRETERLFAGAWSISEPRTLVQFSHPVVSAFRRKVW